MYISCARIKHPILYATAPTLLQKVCSVKNSLQYTTAIIQKLYKYMITFSCQIFWTVVYFINRTVESAAPLSNAICVGLQFQRIIAASKYLHSLSSNPSTIVKLIYCVTDEYTVVKGQRRIL